MNSEQEIVKEYFQQQEKEKFKLCIYEEKASGDIEWFYNGNEWCYLKQKKYKEKIGDETYSGIKLYVEKKRIKTFGKKCHIIKMSFDNFMALDYMSFKNVDLVDLDELHLYSNNFMKIKKEKESENIIYTLDDYHKQIIQDEENAEKKAKEILIGCLGWLSCLILFLLAFKLKFLFILILLFNPLSIKLISKFFKN